jgi:hypothetical protein
MLLYCNQGQSQENDWCGQSEGQCPRGSRKGGKMGSKTNIFLIVQAHIPQTTCSCTATRGKARRTTGAANPKGRVQGAAKGRQNGEQNEYFKCKKKSDLNACWIIEPNKTISKKRDLMFIISVQGEPSDYSLQKPKSIAVLLIPSHVFRSIEDPNIWFIATVSYVQ